MIAVESPDRGRLAGRAVFLSASVPDPERDPRFLRNRRAHVEVKEAVVSLARAVFSEGGRLVFGAHPSISPLVALVAGEYLGALPGRGPSGHGEASGQGGASEDCGASGHGGAPPPPVVLYQLRAFEKLLPDATRSMVARGHAELHWTEVHPRERDLEVYNSRTAPRSFRRMRCAMLRETRPVAMVAVGGMEGVLYERRMFSWLVPDAPVYLLERTGGAAAMSEHRSPRELRRMRFIDQAVLEKLGELEEDLPTDLRKSAWEPEVVPYPLIMQTIVRELVERGPTPG